jgi:hypothetical protein
MQARVVSTLLTHVHRCYCVTRDLPFGLHGDLAQLAFCCFAHLLQFTTILLQAFFQAICSLFLFGQRLFELC